MNGDGVNKKMNLTEEERHILLLASIDKRLQRNEILQYCIAYFLVSLTTVLVFLTLVFNTQVPTTTLWMVFIVIYALALFITMFMFYWIKKSVDNMPHKIML